MESSYLKYCILPLLLVFATGCVPLTPSTSGPSTPISFTDAEYSELVGLVQVYPNTNNPQASLDYPVLPLRNDGLRVTFDLLEENYRYLNAKYISCSANWQPSGLADIQFLTTYNEFPIRDYDYSANTRTPYVHYEAVLPPPQLPGNYLLVVYNENNPDDVLFTRRFLVFDQLADIDVRILPSSIVSQRQTHHQLEFSIKYELTDNINPMRDFRVVILQNHNWATGIYNLEPTLMRPDQNYLEYRHFNGENTFAAGNEFRFFDLRSIDYRGMNVANVRKDTAPVQAFLGVDKSRGELAYAQVNDDRNGGFFLQNNDPNDSQMQSEYAEVFFEVLSEELAEDVYVTGRFNSWGMDSTSLMQYDASRGSYRSKQLLKQGYYEYQYAVGSADRFKLEGNHFQVENNYEILLYYRDITRNLDALVGYRRVSSGN